VSVSYTEKIGQIDERTKRNSPMTIVVLGADGQLAKDLCCSLPADRVVPLGRQDLNVVDQAAMSERLRSLRPSMVVNTAAYNRVDDAEEHVDAAFAVNAFAVRHLSRLCQERGCVLVHFSTDYVFGASESRKPWSENDPPVPLSVYGASKLCGEHFVRAYCEKHFIIRTSGLFGLRRGGSASNFVEAILRKAQQTGRLRVVNDQTCAPSYTADVAEITLRLIKTQAFGTYHVTNAGHCTWHDFATEILRQSGVSADCEAITSAEYGAKAKRPPFSVLSNDKLVASGIAQAPPWHDALSRYLSRRKSPRAVDR
jgi:dTDP-4-dehydrorhamnose reductase